MLLEQLGPLNKVPESAPMPMKLEAWPGGRWYRDLGGENGHFWAHVQAIKRPTPLELNGPLALHVLSRQFKFAKPLERRAGGTLIKFRHLALGLIEDDHRKGAGRGWSTIHARVKAAAEGARAHRARAPKGESRCAPHAFQRHLCCWADLYRAGAWQRSSQTAVQTQYQETFRAVNLKEER